MNVGVATTCFGPYCRWLPEWEAMVAALDPPAAQVTIVGDTAAREAWGGTGRFVHAPELGDPFQHAAAKNRAVAETPAEWIRLIGVDDLLLPGVLADVAPFMARADVIATDAVRQHEDGQPAGSRQNRPTRALILRPTKGRQPLDATAFFRRALWEQAPYRETMDGASDVALWIDFAHLGARFTSTGRPGMIHRLHAGSLWHTRPPEQQRRLRDQLNDLRLSDKPARLEERDPGRVSVSVMAHPAREHFIPYLTSRLPEGTPVVWDERNDRWDTGGRAWEAHDPGATHHLVVQDDAILPENLTAALERMVAYLPDEPVSLYLGRAKPHGPMVSIAARHARLRGASFLRGPGPWWGVGILLPTSLIPGMLGYARTHREVVQYDLRIARWAQAAGLQCWYTMPSLVDHRTEGNPSLLRAGHGRGRRAHWFPGENQDARDLAWDGGYIDVEEAANASRDSRAFYVLNMSDRTISRGGYAFAPGEEQTVVLTGLALKEVRACRALAVY